MPSASRPHSHQQGIFVDFIGSDDLSVPELLTNRRVNFLNLRGEQSPMARPARKMARVLTYYLAPYLLQC